MYSSAKHQLLYFLVQPAASITWQCIGWCPPPSLRATQTALLGTLRSKCWVAIPCPRQCPTVLGPPSPRCYDEKHIISSASEKRWMIPIYQNISEHHPPKHLYMRRHIIDIMTYWDKIGMGLAQSGGTQANDAEQLLDSNASTSVLSAVLSSRGGQVHGRGIMLFICRHIHLHSWC